MPALTPITLATPISLPGTAPEMLAFDPAPIEVPASLPPAPPPPPPLPLPLPATATEPSYSAGYLRNPPPAYPAASRRNGEQGTVLLRVLVNAAGDPAHVEIRRSSGYYRLDNAARDAVRRWKFVPGKRGGEPVDAWVIIPLAFSLTS